MLGRECYGTGGIETYSNLFFFSIILVALGFFVGLSSKGISFLTLEVAYWVFWVGVCLVSLLVFLQLFILVRNFVTDNFYTPMKKIKEYKERIEKERKKIKKFLKCDIERKPIEDLREHMREEFADNEVYIDAEHFDKWFDDELNFTGVPKIINKRFGVEK